MTTIKLLAEGNVNMLVKTLLCLEAGEERKVTVEEAKSAFNAIMDKHKLGGGDQVYARVTLMEITHLSCFLKNDPNPDETYPMSKPASDAEQTQLIKKYQALSDQ